MDHLPIQISSIFPSALSFLSLPLHLFVLLSVNSCEAEDSTHPPLGLKRKRDRRKRKVHSNYRMTDRQTTSQDAGGGGKGPHLASLEAE
jgi:hypothetical protein